MPYTYDHPRPAVTVDCVVFGLDDSDLKVLLIQRRKDPFAGKWAIPGGFVEMDEDLETAARRELTEETGLTNVFPEQFQSFGTPGRDPRGRTISVAYFALVNLAEHPATAADDAKDANWFRVAKLPPLAFDHDQILAMAIARLRAKARYQPIGLDVLPRRFMSDQLQQLYETILKRKLEKRSFGKKILALGLLIELPKSGGGDRLYRFDLKMYKKLTKEGFNLEL